MRPPCDLGVGVLVQHFHDPAPVRRVDRLAEQLAAAERVRKGTFRSGSDAVGEEVGHLGDHERRHEKRALGVGQQVHAPLLVAVASGGGGDEGTGVDDEHQPRWRARLSRADPTKSSTRSDASAGPPSPTPKNDKGFPDLSG